MARRRKRIGVVQYGTPEGAVDTVRGCSCPKVPSGLSETVVLSRGKKSKVRMGSSADICETVRPVLGFRPQEEFWVVPVDNKNQILGYVRAAVGQRSEVRVDPVNVFQPAIAANAARVFLVHNHPSGDATPGAGDSATTKRLVAAGQLLGIPVLDHIVVTRTHCASMRDLGLMQSVDGLKKTRRKP